MSSPGNLPKVAPIAVLPGWARAVAPATPSYWAMRGFPEVALPIAVLLGIATIFTVVAGLRFRFDDVKVSFA